MAGAGKCVKTGLSSVKSVCNLQKTLFAHKNKEFAGLTSHAHVSSLPKGPTFGLFFDIDGVIVRGRKVLPHARDALKLLTDANGKFWVPTIFVTNAGNCMRQTKAQQLSEWLNIEIAPQQVVMSHSPIKMFRQFLDKHVLVTGQGPTTDIAKNLGFKHITTIEMLRKCFPKLDTMDHARRQSAPCAFEKYFPKIEAVIMFGEPVRWEMNLQLIIDVLLTNGKPAEALPEIPYPHIPVLGCNVDLMWMAEAPMPRFGHGAFLHCLESLYKKISGYELKYTALVGKPSEITYHHSEDVLQTEARDMGLPGISTMYCVGDNPDVDIYGANLFNRYLQKKTAKRAAKRHKALGHGAEMTWDEELLETVEEPPLTAISTATEPVGEIIGAESCKSILVATGVYSNNRDDERSNKLSLDHMHRDFIMDPELRKPTIEATDILGAVQSVFRAEGITT